MVPVCAAVEADIAELDDDERDEFMAELGLEEPGLNRVIRAGYRLPEPPDLLYRRGERSSRMDHSGWRNCRHRQRVKSIPTSKKALSAPKLSPLTTLLPIKVNKARKRPVRMRAEGKDYIVKDGDVMNFLFNV
nr:ATP/GTP-binding protein [Salmonella sp. NCTC 7297]